MTIDALVKLKCSQQWTKATWKFGNANGIKGFFKKILSTQPPWTDGEMLFEVETADIPLWKPVIYWMKRSGLGRAGRD